MAAPALALPRNSRFVDLPSSALRDIAISSGQCRQTCDGALVLQTGKHTGRAANDRFIVENAASVASVAWGKVNRPLANDAYQELHDHVRAHLGSTTSYELHLHAGGSAGARVRVVTTSPAHALFCRALFQDAARFPAGSGAPITVLHAPDCLADPDVHGTRSETFVVLDLLSRTVLIGGTAYAGELKKAVFSLLSFALPEADILPMHAAVNVGAAGDSAVFFGLSGTGKTTLSADPSRFLLGDDEHGWSAHGLFNLEGGCYAKTLGLRQAQQPHIWQAVHGWSALLENAVLSRVTAEVAWDDASLTENARAAYPLEALPRVWPEPIVRTPGHVIFLTADAFGVLPPVAELSAPQALYYFLSGYTAKLAGTEGGSARPEPTFSTCFGAPFMPRPAATYARLLRRRLQASKARVWLVNTGWTGGGNGTGQRIPLGETRQIVSAILAGELNDVPKGRYGRFGLAVPAAVPGVRTALLNPRACWSDPALYDRQEGLLALRFTENFCSHAADVSRDVLEAGPA
jgi:phosphoenolpyruvate carboxykinase (ATP)